MRQLEQLQWWASYFYQRMVRTGLKPNKACENRVGDQSILNFYYRSRWTSLPPAIRVRPASLWLNEQHWLAHNNASVASPAAHPTSPLARQSGSGGGGSGGGSAADAARSKRQSIGVTPALLHFLAEPKPWLLPHGTIHPLRMLWSRVCGVSEPHAAGEQRVQSHQQARDPPPPAPPAQSATGGGQGRRAANDELADWAKAMPPALEGKEGVECWRPCNMTLAGRYCDFCGSGWLCCRKDHPSPSDVCREPLNVLRSRFVRMPPPRGWVCVNPARRQPCQDISAI